MDDKIAPLLRPDLIAKFDEIPPQFPISVALYKGDIAHLIKYWLSLRKAFADVVLGAATRSEDEEFRTIALQCFSTLEEANQHFNIVANRLMSAIVDQAERHNDDGTQQ